MEKLKNNENVVIHSFGDGLAARGIIKGIAFDDGRYRSYIVELRPDNPWNQEYSCITIPESCLIKTADLHWSN